MASPSSTIPNWFCGLVCSFRWPVTMRNCSAPSGLNSSSTSQATEFCGTPAFARLTCSPLISTGPSRYLYWLALSQVIRGSVLTSGKLSPHLKLWKSFVSRSLGFHASSLSRRCSSGLPVAVLDGDAELPGVALAVAPGLADAVASSVGVAVGSTLGRGLSTGWGSVGTAWESAADSAWYTLRKFSCAVWPTIFASSSLVTLGTETTIWRSPDVVTSDSPTPIASTRRWMI